MLLVLRYLFGLFFLGASINKFVRGYLWSDALQKVFMHRLEEIDPASVGHAFLTNFGIPYYVPISWIVTWGETAVTIGLLLGLMTRWSAGLAIFLMVMFGMGGYYDASLIALCAMALLIAVFPTGRWLGLDRQLHARNPRSVWFR
jgi:thiosulfate dehydrogenase [quinone] large subunit